jgi:hypothetical protein
MKLSKADQYVEDYKKFKECKEPEILGFCVEETRATVYSDGAIVVHSFGYIQKEHALAFAQWIIDTYSVPEETKPVQEEPKLDWSIPVVGMVYITRAWDAATREK